MKKLFLCLLLLSSSLRTFAAAPGWSVNPAEFDQTAALTGIITINGSVSNDPNDKIAAFIDGEVRGVASPPSSPNPFGQYTFGMTINSDASSSSNITFKVYDASNDVIVNSGYTQNFTANAVWGNAASPENITATVVITEPDINVNPASKNYGNTLVSGTSSQTFVVSNDGTADLSVSAVSLTGTDPGQFSIDAGGGAFTLVPGATRNVDVSFNPTTEGAKTATLRLASDDPDENPLDVALSGTGTVIPDINASPTSNAYGDVLVGGTSSQTFVIGNDGTGDLSVSSVTLTGTNADQFSIDAGGGAFTLAPGATRNIDVSFNPTSAGAKSASLTLASDDPDENPLDIALDGTGTSPDISIDPASKNYGFVPVGSSANQTFVVSNDGTADLNVTNVVLSGANADQFSIDAGGGAFTLAPGATRNIDVSFNPTSADAKAASLDITSDDPDESPLNVALTGNDVSPDIAVNPTSKDYANVVVGSNDSQTFVVSNEGAVDLNVTGVALTGANADQFSIDAGGGAFTLAPGATRNVDVSFNPTSLGANAATLQFTSNDPNENPLDVALSGTGVLPDIAVNPTTKDYGNILVGGTSSQTFVVSNEGTSDLSVSSVALSGTNSGQFSIDAGGGTFTLAPGATRNVDVSFNPTTVGAKTASLTLASDDPGENPLDVALSGIGIEQDIAANPTSRAYGNVLVGGTSSQTIVISNAGTADLSVSSVILTGANPDEFSIDAGGGAFTLAPGATRNVDVSFNPTTVGAKTASLTLASDDPDENPFNVALTGTGTQPDISIDPTSKNYLFVPVGSSGSQTFVVSNDGTATLNVTSVTLGGTNPGEFSIDAGDGAFTLAPGATRNVDVSFNPTTTGGKTATLSIVNDDPDENPLDVALSGNVVEPDIAINPTSKDYGTHEVGTATSQTFVVSNQGTVDLSVTNVALTGTDAAEFSIDAGGGAFTLAPGATRNVDVSFNPATEGAKTATLQITSNDPDQSPLDVALTGTGAIIPDIAVNPTSKDYGSVPVGNSASQTFVVSNEGTADLNVTDVALTGTDAAEFSIDASGGAFTLAPGATRNVDVSFKPTTAGAKAAVLQITSNDPDESPLNVLLAGTNIQDPDIAIDPTSKDYGIVKIGSFRHQQFTISNSGLGDLNVTDVQFAGYNPHQFRIQSGGGAFTVPPGGTHDINVSFAPTSYGGKSAKLQIISNDPDENPLEAELSGIGGVNVTVNTDPAGREFTVDGTVYTSEQTFLWEEGSDHTVEVATPQAGATGVQYLYNSWSDGGAQSHTYTTPGAAATLTANFTTQYLLTTAENPDEGGDITPAPPGGWYDAGTIVDLDVTVNTGYAWAGWSGDISGTEKPTTITMDAPKNVTANWGENLVQITVNTDPEGREFTVDGTDYTSEQTFLWEEGSDHTVEVASPQNEETGVQYLYDSWSDGGAQSHTYTTPGAPATLTVNFTTQYLLTTAENPDEGGDITPAPPGGWYDAGTVVDLDVTVNTGYTWTGWTGDLTGTDKPTTITMDVPKSVTANFGENTFEITVNTVPDGLEFTVDGTAYSSEQTFMWEEGSDHTVEVASPQAGETGIQYVYNNWSDGGTQSHTYTTPGAPATLTANFTTQYLLTTTENPDEGGDITPAPPGGWYDAGTVVDLDATVNTGYTWTGWTGDLTSTDKPATITMDAPKSIAANFGMNQYTLAVTIDPAGSGSVQVTPSQAAYGHGTVVSLKANPATGYVFSEWTGDATGTNDSITVEMLANKVIVAHFIILDVTAPTLKNVFPVPGAKAVPKNTAISLKVEDNTGGYGVDLSTLQVSVDGTAIVVNGVADVSSGVVAITSHSPKYTVDYLPSTPFTEGTTVSVNVIASDLAPGTNSLDSTFAFDIGVSSITPVAGDTMSQAGGVIEDSGSQVQVTVPANALSDTVVIAISETENPPAMPDTIQGMGIAYHFSPDGLQFNEPVTIRLPYTADDFAEAGVTDPMDLPVYYYSSMQGQWIQVTVVDADGDFVYIEVTEFCYFMYAKANNSSVEDRCLSLVIPEQFDLKQNYPNPFNPETVIRYDLAESGDVSISIYNIQGRKVRTLIQSYKRAGSYEVIWDGCDDYGYKVTTGLYLYVIQAGSFNKVMKATLLK